MTQPRRGWGMGIDDMPGPQGSGVAATLGYGIESRWDSNTIGGTSRLVGEPRAM